MSASSAAKDLEIRIALRKVAFPSTIGFLFNTMFNITDNFFAAKISTAAQAGLGISFPLFFILISLGVGFSNGITALVGIELGKNNSQKAGYIHLQSILLLTVFSVIFLFFGEIPVKFGLHLLGASGEYYKQAYEYTRVIYIMGFSILIVQAINAGLVAQQKTTYFRNGLILSFFLNILLDPIFMLGLFGFPRLDAAGAAWSTSLLNTLGILYLGYQLKKTNLLAGLTLKDYIPDFKIWGKVLAQGIPSFLGMLMISIYFSIINFFISQYGVETVAAFGIGIRIEQIALIPSIGIGIGTLAMTAHYYGSGDREKILRTRQYAFRLSIIITASSCLVIFLLRYPMMVFFSQDTTVINIGAEYLLFASIFTLANSNSSLNNSFLQGLKHPILAMFGNLFRHVVLPLIFLNLVTIFFPDDLRNFWLTLLIMAWTGLLFSFFLAHLGFRLSKI